MTQTILILAAGTSSRMRGRDKLLENVEGQPLLRLMAKRALGTGKRVTITLPPDNPDRLAALNGVAAKLVFVADAAKGMSASIRRGVAAIGEVDGLMILPADMPELSTADIERVWNTFDANDRAKIVRGAGVDGTAGHPVVFPATLLNDLEALDGDAGASTVVRKHGFVPVSLPDRHALTDLDTPEEWEEWRARKAQGSKTS